MCGLNINEFYKDKYSDREKDEIILKEEVKPETKEEKARRFEEILRNAGNFQRNEEEVESFEILNKDDFNGEDKKVSEEKVIETDPLDEVKSEKVFDEGDEKTSDVVEDKKVSEEEIAEETEEVIEEEEEDSQRTWEEESLNRAKGYINSPDDNSPVDLKATFAEINFKTMKTVFNPLRSFMKLLATSGGFYKDFFILL